MQFPSLSAASPPDLVRAHFDIRYDDLSQDGRIKLSALQLVLGRVSFGEIWTRHPLFSTRQQGILPILSRLVLESDPVPISFSAPLEGRGQLELAHEPAADGGVAALFMNTYGEIWARRSRRGSDVGQHDPTPRELVRVGRAFGEHVFTRPFAAAHSRKVLAFDVRDQPSVPSARHRRTSTGEALALPQGAEAIDADFLADDVPWVFGLIHTDANQHVNSLVYARLFEEAALRRLSRQGWNTALRGRRIELLYRKPSFAGDRMYCRLRSYTLNHQPAAIGYLSASPEPSDRPHSIFHLHFGA
jgi:hypothetical protein